MDNKELKNDKVSIIADFFNGSGTTYRVAKKLNRRFIGCDINPQSANLCNVSPSNLSEIENPLGKVFIMDNLVFMDALYQRFNSFIDLIYIDPPFGRNSVDSMFGIDWCDLEPNEELLSDLYGKSKHILTQENKSYLSWLYPRVNMMFKLLDIKGSLYLHCDSYLSHYIKIMLDFIFITNGGYFQNEIIWCYSTGGVSKKRYAKKHDNIFFYTKTDEYIFNVDDVREPYNKIETTKFKQVNDKFYKRQHELGKIPLDWWELSAINNVSKERLNYPTQKPEKLIEKIIKASTVGLDNNLF